MRPLEITISIGWISFWIYWIISALSSKKSSTGNNIRLFLGFRIITIALVVIFVSIFRRLPISLKDDLHTDNHLVLIMGLLLFLVGMSLAVWARIYLGKNWGMPMTQKKSPELVTSGPYKYVRHPIYSGILLMVLGSIFDVNIFWLLVFVVSLVFFIYSSLVEERLMSKQFPKVYPAYKSKTKMLIPFIF